MTFICQLSKKEQLWWYKAIKRTLLKEGCYTYDNLVNAMNEKVVNLIGLIDEWSNEE